MKAKLLDETGARSWILVFEIGDPVIASLENFAREQGLRGAHLSGIGALHDVVLRYFDWESKEYEDLPVEEQVEVLALTGNIAWLDDDPIVHAHIVIGLRDGSTRGGHLKEGHVRPTLEVVLTEGAERLVRRSDEETGLTLIDLEEGHGIDI